MQVQPQTALRAILVIAVCAFVGLRFSAAQVLRVVTYNIDADTGGSFGGTGGPISGPGLTTVLQAIGNSHLAGNAQPIDVLTLQELNVTSSITLDFIVGQLNAIYGDGTYAYDTTSDPT